MAALSRAAHLQAGIGYWTISDALLGDDPAKRLSGDHGLVCVDLQLPTDIDALADLAARGAQVRVHHESIRTRTAHGRREPPQLALEDAALLVERSHGGAVGREPQLDAPCAARPERRGVAGGHDARFVAVIHGGRALRSSEVAQRQAGVQGSPAPPNEAADICKIQQTRHKVKGIQHHTIRRNSEPCVPLVIG
jgi:hypothetical protein